MCHDPIFPAPSPASVVSNQADSVDPGATMKYRPAVMDDPATRRAGMRRRIG
jgi:hypothetical protein